MRSKPTKKPKEGDAGLFRSALRASLIVCSKDDSRVALNSIRFEIDGCRVRLISTDGHRLLRVSVALDSNKLGDSRQFQISRRDAIRWVNVCSLGGIGQTEVELKDRANGSVLFGLPDAKVTARRVTRDFPPYETITPALADTIEKASHVRLSYRYLRDLADIAPIIQGTEYETSIRLQPVSCANDPIRFDIDAKSRAISATYTLMPMRIQ